MENRRISHKTLYGYCWCRSATGEVHRLRDMCCDALVRDAHLLRRVLHLLPAALIRDLLKRAVQNGRDRAAHLLVSIWPDNSLNLPAVLGGSCPLIHHPGRAVAATTIFRAFVELSLRGDWNHLRSLDATGFQVGPQLIEFVENEMERWRCARKQPRLSPRTVRFDLFIDGPHSFEVLISVLQHPLARCVLRFEVFNLEVEGVGAVKLLQLLEILNPGALAGLSVRHNSVDREALSRVMERLRLFPGLTALDLSLNCITRIDGQLYDYLLDTLQGMPLLQRLNIGGCRIGGRLSALLARCLREMTHLDLSACHLQVEDLDAIGKMQNLACLILSANNFSNMMPELTSVLFVLRHLQVLHLSSCALRADFFVTLWEAVRVSSSNLCSLDLTCNNLSVENMAVILGDVESGRFPRLINLLLPGLPTPAYLELLNRMNAVNSIFTCYLPWSRACFLLLSPLQQTVLVCQ